MEKLAEKLKELRIEKGLSQREVSSALGMTRNAFTNYENGYREPSLENLKKICQFFDVSVILQIIGRDNNAEERFLHTRGMMNCFVSGTGIRIWRT